jgi:hypothetical protein
MKKTHKLYSHGPNMVHDFYLIPTIRIWRNDLTSVNLGITNGVSLVFLKWEVISFWVNTKKEIGIVK